MFEFVAKLMAAQANADTNTTVKDNEATNNANETKTKTLSSFERLCSSLI